MSHCQLRFPLGLLPSALSVVGAGRIDVEHRLLRGSLQRLGLRIRQSGARALADSCNRPTADLQSKLLIEQRPGLAETQRDGTGQQAHQGTEPGAEVTGLHSSRHSCTGAGEAAGAD